MIRSLSTRGSARNRHVISDTLTRVGVAISNYFRAGGVEKRGAISCGPVMRKRAPHSITGRVNMTCRGTRLRLHNGNGTFRLVHILPTIHTTHPPHRREPPQLKPEPVGYRRAPPHSRSSEETAAQYSRLKNGLHKILEAPSQRNNTERKIIRSLIKGKNALSGNP